MAEAHEKLWKWVFFDDRQNRFRDVVGNFVGSLEGRMPLFLRRFGASLLAGQSINLPHDTCRYLGSHAVRLPTSSVQFGISEGVLQFR